MGVLIAAEELIERLVGGKKIPFQKWVNGDVWAWGKLKMETENGRDHFRGHGCTHHGQFENCDCSGSGDWHSGRLRRRRSLCWRFKAAAATRRRTLSVG